MTQNIATIIIAYCLYLFTVIYLQQTTTFSWYLMLQKCCGYNVLYTLYYFPVIKRFLLSHLYLR